MKAGYLTMVVAPADARRREASVTSAGLSMVDDAHRWQEEIFVQLTPGWSDTKRREFQQAMVELMDSSYAMEA